jgi:hypothetical protein
MGQQKKCAFYRASEEFRYGIGVGLCDLEGGNTICEGDIRYCENAQALISYLFQENLRHTSHRVTKTTPQRVNATNP